MPDGGWKPRAESWALGVLDAVVAGQPWEDMFVELKRSWPTDTNKVARRVAAHGNAARGEDILWLIGVDQKAKSVLGASAIDFISWWQPIAAEFDGITPEPNEIRVPYEGVDTFAIIFQTDRAPYVVRNIRHGATKDPVAWEVPWRNGTRTDSARRDQLLRILMPQQQLPMFESLEARLECVPSPEDLSPKKTWNWYLHFDLYVTPRDEGRVTLPFRKCECWVRFVDRKKDLPLKFTASEPRSFGPLASETRSRTIEATQDEALIYGPGRLQVIGRSGSISPWRKEPREDAEATVVLRTAEGDTSAVLRKRMVRDWEDTRGRLYWRSEPIEDGTS